MSDLQPNTALVPSPAQPVALSPIEQAAQRGVPAMVAQRGEKFLELLDAGKSFAVAMTQSDFGMGQYRLMQSVPGFVDRVNQAMRSFKEVAARKVLGKAVDILMEGDTRGVLTKEGEEVQVKVPFDSNLAKTVLSGLDKDFAQIDKKEGGGNVAPVIININMPKDVMASIAEGNEDEQAHSVSLPKMKKLIDVEAVEGGQ